MVTLISFLIVLSILTLVHELGHFIVGRWAGARIEEFAIGFPPRLWSTRRGETDYSINSIPLGGYVRFAGEDNPDVKDGLSNLPRLKRTLVLIAGVTMNALLAVVIFTVMYASGYPTAVPADGIKVVVVSPGSPAEQAGLKPGDVVLQVNGQAINDMAVFSAAVRNEPGKPISLLVKTAGGEQTNVQLTPRANPPAGEGPLGVAIQPATLQVRTHSPVQALQLGLQTTWEVVKQTLSVPIMIMRGLIPASDARLTGPLGISRVVGGAAEAIPVSGLYPILFITALLSISIAVVNILPFPGLDGGRLLFVLIEALRGGKRIDPQREAVIHFAGLMLLMGLVAVITYFDIVSPAPPINWGP
jgi:regulator of sigma E protease